MALKNIGIVYRKELREAVRDRRTLLSSLIAPLLLFPLVTAGFGALFVTLLSKAKEEKSPVMLLGAENSPGLAEWFAKIENVDVVPPSADWKEKIGNKEIRAAVEIPKEFDAALSRETAGTVEIYKYKGELKSEITSENLENKLKEYRERMVEARLGANHLPVSLLKPFAIEQQNVAPPEKVGGAAFAGVIGYMVILLCFTGGMYPAMDLTAGEKERGTMETILSSPVSRVDLVLGKFFLVLTTTLITAALSVTSMGVSFWVMGQLHAFDAAGSDAATLQLSIGPKAALSIFVMVLPVAVLFSAVLLAVSLFAKSYKEAQSYITPMMVFVIVPAVAAMLPIDLTGKLALVPVLNASLLCKELVTGTYHWNYIAIIFVSTSVYAAAALFFAVKLFQREDVLFRS
jgi:sodium transport system permease protein